MKRKNQNLLKARENNLNSQSKRHLFIPLAIIAFVVFLDQITKIWAVHSLTFNNSIEVIGRFFMFTLVYNEGGAMGTSLGSSDYYLISASLILLFVLYYIYVNRSRLLLSVPLSFIAGGAIGNLIDRITLGKVIDFIDIDFFNINLFGFHLERWWTFNIADSAISCSIVYLLYLILTKKLDRADDETKTNQTND